jgi:hypothetical protein
VSKRQSSFYCAIFVFPSLRHIYYHSFFINFKFHPFAASLFTTMLCLSDCYLISVDNIYEIKIVIVCCLSFTSIVQSSWIKNYWFYFIRLQIEKQFYGKLPSGRKFFHSPQQFYHYFMTFMIVNNH